VTRHGTHGVGKLPRVLHFLSFRLQVLIPASFML
jgi:hypothetical protein